MNPLGQLVNETDTYSKTTDDEELHPSQLSNLSITFMPLWKMEVDGGVLQILNGFQSF